MSQRPEHIANEWRGLAKCPLCGKIYKARMTAKWIGNGMPRIYHHACRDAAINAGTNGSEEAAWRNKKGEVMK